MMDVFKRRCGCGAILNRLEQCAPCTKRERERAIAKAGPRQQKWTTIDGSHLLMPEPEQTYTRYAGLRVIGSPGRVDPAVPRDNVLDAVRHVFNTVLPGSHVAFESTRPGRVVAYMEGDYLNRGHLVEVAAEIELVLPVGVYLMLRLVRDGFVTESVNVVARRESRATQETSAFTFKRLPYGKHVSISIDELAESYGIVRQPGETTERLRERLCKRTRSIYG